MRSKTTQKNNANSLTLADQVDAKARRKVRARRSETPGLWFGLGMMGIIGWSIAVPTILGAALGLWLDRTYHDGHGWTLALLVAGLSLGCMNAWLWISKEDKAMSQDNEQSERDDA